MSKFSQMFTNAANTPVSKTLGKFLTKNKVPRYFIYAIIAAKMTTIYDKLR